MTEVWRRYSSFLRLPPELTVSWRDRETPARGWLVVNSMRGGAAGGGTRMRPGVGPREVVYLAKSMELKFALAGPPVGGAKCGIDFDPADPRKQAVLERWYGAIAPYLRELYGTGGDLNVDEVTEVIPCCSRLGLRHPQEGIVRGHLRPAPDRFQRILSALDAGVKAPACPLHGLDGCALTIADVVTGYGVASAIRAFYAVRTRDVTGSRLLIEGFGNVGGACALYLARAGAVIVGIRDSEKALIAPDGLEVAEVESLLRQRRRGLLPVGDPRVRRGAAAAAFWRMPADIFVCAATSGTITPETLARLSAAGVEVIGCGANQPFREARLGSTRVQRTADTRFAVLPDILANCGMARALSYLMGEGAEPTCDGIMAAVDTTIQDRLREAVALAGGRPTNLLGATLALALDRTGAV